MGSDPQIESPKESIVLFDGICNLCNASVNFIIDRDPQQHFRFASLQQAGEIDGLKALDAEAQELSSIMLLDRGRVYKKSTAALRIARGLSGGWPLCYALIIIPSFIRDGIYEWIARNRYRWFGQQETCRLPEPHLKDRFLA
ncbi:MAG: DCC1-like thiol-disulfide oxidoreductase family protein [Bacteroidota bacterium]